MRWTVCILVCWVSLDQTPKKAPVKPGADDSVLLTGTLLSPAGKPVVGQTVCLVGEDKGVRFVPFRLVEGKMTEAVAKTNAVGRFAIRTRRLAGEMLGVRTADARALAIGSYQVPYLGLCTCAWETTPAQLLRVDKILVPMLAPSEGKKAVDLGKVPTEAAPAGGEKR